MRGVFRSAGLRLLILFVASAFGPRVAYPAQADWVASAFPERAHDFGKVARGSKLRHSFRVVNQTDRPIRIQGWRTKCGCTEVRLGAKVIPPGSQSFVEATLDTTRFTGPKSSGLTLVLDQPAAREVELGLTCDIQSELTVSPGLADFGTVTRSDRPQLVLGLLYGGPRPDWRVVEMKTNSAALSARLEDAGPSGTGARQYRLTASLDPQGLREGRFKDQITLITNDPRMPQVPISVAARIQSVVALSPAVIDLGKLKVGQEVEQTVLVRAPTAFKVVKAEVVAGECEVPPPSDEAKNLHVMKLRFRGAGEVGPAHAIVEFTTDVANEPPIRLTAFINIVP